MQIIKETAKVIPENTEMLERALLKEDLGIDSILLIRLLIIIEDRAGIDIPFEGLQRVNVKTPLDLWEILCDFINK